MNMHERPKMLQMLRLFIACLILGIGTEISYATNTYSSKKYFSISVQNKSVKEILNYIEQNSEFIFFYLDANIDLDRKVDLNLKDQRVEAILEKVFANTENTYIINDRQIVISKRDNNASETTENTQQTKKIKVTGVVTDGNGESIIGAAVMEKGTSNGVTTDIDGRYVLEVSQENAIITVSYLGYTTQDVKVDGRRNINIQLFEDSKALDEVVIIGYGQQTKSSVVSSINTIKSETLSVPSRNLTNNLAGQVAGLIAVQRSGEPGYDNSEFWIRGVSTFKGGSDPLVLVDGIPRSMADIEPDEIETFSLLKDAAATAVYGAEGANGVILITTKRGREAKPKFTFRAEGTLLTPTKLPEFLGAKDFMEAWNEANMNEGKEPFYSQELIDKYASHIDPDLYPDVNWMDLLKDHTFNQRYTLNVNGGSARARYFVSAAYYSEKGLFESNGLEKYETNIGLERFNLRSNIDIDVSKSTIINVDISGQYLMTNYPGQSTSEIFSAITRTAPNQIPMIYSDGSLAGHTYHSGNRNNPYNLINHSGYIKEWRTNIQSKVTLNQKLDAITKGLSFKGSVSFDANALNKVSRLKNPTLYHATGRNEDGTLQLKEVVAGSENLSESISSSNDKQIYLEASLNYQRTFGAHNVSGMLLYMQKEQSYSNQALPYRKQGFVGRVAYSYGNRYFIEGSFGYTGSENFADGHRFGIFPAVGAGYLISEEAFYPDGLKNVVNKLKLRASYGRTGNDQTGSERFVYREKMNQGGGGYNLGILDGSSTGGVGNSIWEARFAAPTLSWEIENKQNYGIDLGLFDNRIDITADYFSNRRHNILLQRQTVLGVAGFQQMPWQNFGIVTNKGVDASMTVNHHIGDWKLSARANVTFARNKIIEQDEVPQPYPWMNNTGTRINSWDLYIAEGLYKEEDFIITGEGLNRTYKLKEGVVKSDLSDDIKPGDIKYKDINGDGVINSYDIVQDVGDPSVPELVYGFGFNVEWKGWYAGIFFQGAGNTSTVIGASNPELIFPFTWGLEESSLRSVVMNRWSENNQSDDVMFPRLRTNTHAHNNAASTWWQRDVSFIRLKNLEIGYNFNERILKKTPFNALRIYMMGNNLAVWDSLNMWDPEIGNANEGCNYPLSRTFTLGLEVSF